MRASPTGAAVGRRRAGRTRRSHRDGPTRPGTLFSMLPVPLHRAVGKAAAGEVVGCLVSQVQYPRRQHQPTSQRPGPEEIGNHSSFFNRHTSRARLHHARRHHLPGLNCVARPAKDLFPLSQQHPLMIPVEALRNRLPLPRFPRTADRFIRQSRVLQRQQILPYLVLGRPAKCEHENATGRKLFD